MASALHVFPLTTGTQRQPEEQGESYQRPSASPSPRVSSSAIPPAASSHWDPPVSRPMGSSAPPVHQPAPVHSDPHVSMPAVVPSHRDTLDQRPFAAPTPADPSLPYPVPVSQSAGDDSSLPAPVAPSVGGPFHAGLNNSSTDAITESPQANSRQVPGPANAGGFTGQDITDQGTTTSTRMSVPVESALRSELMYNGRFLDPEKYEPVKLLGCGGFAKVVYYL